MVKQVLYEATRLAVWIRSSAGGARRGGMARWFQRPVQLFNLFLRLLAKWRELLASKDVCDIWGDGFQIIKIFRTIQQFDMQGGVGSWCQC